MHLPVDLVFRILIWGTLVLGVLLIGLVLMGAGIQFRRDRQNRHRIALFEVWETDLAAFLFNASGTARPFPEMAEKDQFICETFLARYYATLAGQEADALRELYLGLGAVRDSLPGRLKHRKATVRAQAAQEVRIFRLDDQLEAVLPLLNDPVPYVTHLAAQALTRSGDLRYAQPVLDWVLREERYQRERLLRVLEGFGPELLPWMKAHLVPPNQYPEPWILYVMLVGAHRHAESQPRLLWLLEVPHLNLRVAVLKALIVLADPTVYPRVLPFASSPAWEIRAQAARALGVLGGPSAIPSLLSLMADQVYEVRRNAAQGLIDLGHAGISAMTWLAEDATADRFARDIALERMEWVDERGHQ